MRSRGHACSVSNHLPMNLGLDEITLCVTMDPTIDSDSDASAQGDSIAVTEWKELFEEISRLLCDCERNAEEVANQGRAEYIYEQLKNTVLTVRRLYASVLDYFCDNPVCETTSDLIDKLSTLEEQLLTVELPYWQQKVDLLPLSIGEFETPSTIHHDHQRGRPPFDVDTEQIIYLREIGFTWNDVSIMLGISRMTLYRKRKQAGISDNNRYFVAYGNN